jgi:hypothetical protein
MGSNDTAAARPDPPGHIGRRHRRRLPVFGWLFDYDASWLRGDVVAGLTVWAVLVPEALAYASIAGETACTRPCWQRSRRSSYGAVGTGARIR